MKSGTIIGVAAFAVHAAFVAGALPQDLLGYVYGMGMPEFLRGASFTSGRGLLGAWATLALFVAGLTKGLNASISQAAISYVALGSAVAATWVWRRRLPRFKTNELGILVALRATGSFSDVSKVESVLRRLCERLEDIANGTGLNTDGVRVRVQRLPTHIQGLDRDKIGRIADKARAVYVVWANGTAGYGAGEPMLRWEAINLLVRHRPISSTEAAGFQASVRMVAIPPRKYSVLFANDAFDIDDVAKNLDLLAKYQIGMALAANGVRSPAIRFLTEASQAEGQRDDYKGQRDDYNRRAASVAGELLLLPWGPDTHWPRPGDDEPLLNQALEDARRASVLDQSSYAPHAIAACCLFLLGDTDGAIHANGLMKDRLDKSHQAIFDLNAAVFAISRGRFDLAISAYRRAIRHGLDRETTTSCMLWLYSAVDHLDRSYTLGTAIMNDFVVDSSVALAEYQSVVALLSGAPRAAKFVDERISSLAVRPHGEMPVASRH